ncbi:MAG TPA: peptidoglycan DD-metalloendopeptidase family protein [Chitinophagaceae bacterium]|nr:peptidoglycan DD-metalloendopeptidase family protein [Chitinophagaceae bacterium]
MNQALAFKNISKTSGISFNRVIPFDPVKDKLVLLDFTAANEELEPGILNDITRFSQWVNNKLEHSHARYGIGGYAEHRTVYSASKVFDGNNDGEEPRRLHLGTDIWGKPNTAVIAPLDGIVHSFAFNNRFGDYGATIILSHNLQGFTFFTLYGHLSLNSIKNIREGQRISAGEIFAEFGIPAENGQWPPHLHFQIILDIGNWHGDYPGVCKFSEKEKWLANSPDPDIILQLNQYL